MTTSIGKRVREERLRIGLSLTALARASGLTKGFISQLESGRATTSIGSLGRIADALHVEPSELLHSLPSHGTAPSDGRTETEVVREGPEGRHVLVRMGSGSRISIPPLRDWRRRAPGLCVALRGKGALYDASMGSSRLLLAEEAASWPVPAGCRLEAVEASTFLLFLPDGVALPQIEPAVDNAGSGGPEDRNPRAGEVPEGPLKLVAMRAARKAGVETRREG